MNREQDIILLLGMAYGLSRCFQEHMRPDQIETLKIIKNGIDRLFYSKQDLSIPTKRDLSNVE